MSKGLLYTLVGLIATFAIAAFTIVFSTNLPILAVILLLAALTMSGIILFSLKRAIISQPRNDISKTNGEPQSNSNRLVLFIAGFVFVILFISSIYAIFRLKPARATITNTPPNIATPYNTDGLSNGSSDIEPEPTATQSISQPTLSGTIKTTRPYQGRIAAGFNFVAALTDDGKVICVGDTTDINVADWENIKQISAHGYHLLGLYENGTVVFTGTRKSHNDEVADWKDIVQVATCFEGSLGLTREGKVRFTGFDRNNISKCRSWTNIAKILEGEAHVLGITKAGQVIAAGYPNDNRTNVTDLSNVVEGCAGNATSFIVLADGSVTPRGKDYKGEDYIGDWTDIVAIACGDEHTVGLKKDGTVVAKGNHDDQRCDVEGWTDIIAICAGGKHTVGLKSDGTLVATDYNVAGIDLW